MFTIHKLYIIKINKIDRIKVGFLMAAKQTNALDLELSRLQVSSKSPHLLHKRYSGLYFTWKLPEKGRTNIELHGGKNAKNES